MDSFVEIAYKVKILLIKQVIYKWKFHFCENYIKVQN